MKTYLPKDEKIMSWDPENMDKYWEQCQTFDCFPDIDCHSREKISQQEFKQMVTRRYLIPN
ncbi:hypothetical protein [Aliikangiella coralliicola]|uniref:Uncharacterized protein n=1 Tax=Aliikangiella coralliicola TaxID=2592383 RepID=A0A545TWB7_9GAMM|nr:hypothetical protein [Aliikangiella coralliicola]TQV81516.1 hypothetical protein FLL46_25545 [Aliikangiella coralliicola]